MVLTLGAGQLRQELGEGLFEDYNVFTERFDAALKRLDIRLGAADKKAILQAVSWRDENAPPVIKKVYKPGKAEPAPLHGRFAATVDGKLCVVEYETDSDLRDTEQIPRLEEGGIEAFFEREVLPYVPDAWIDPSATRIGYEISFTRYFYQPPKLRELDEIRAEIEALERETDGLLDDIIARSV